jgi:hypothetical protein
MRHPLVTFLSAFLGVLVALIGFRVYETAEADRARAAQEAAQAARLEQGRRLAEQTIAEAAAAQAIRSDAVAVSMAKAVVAEFYMSQGRMPESNAEAGLGAPDSYHGQSLRSMTLGEGGQLVLEFDASSGVDGGKLEWRPDLTGIESMGMQWQCETFDFPLIARALPDCRSLKAGATLISPAQ